MRTTGSYGLYSHVVCDFVTARMAEAGAAARGDRGGVAGRSRRPRGLRG